MMPRNGAGSGAHLPRVCSCDRQQAFCWDANKISHSCIVSAMQPGQLCIIHGMAECLHYRCLESCESYEAATEVLSLSFIEAQTIVAYKRMHST